jgi:hypothetical protein
MPIDQHSQVPLFESRIATFMPDLAEPEAQKSTQNVAKLWMSTMPRVPPQPLGRAKTPEPRKIERNAVVLMFELCDNRAKEGFVLGKS